MFSNENGVGADLSDELEGALPEGILDEVPDELPDELPPGGEVDDWQFQHRKQHPVAFTVAIKNIYKFSDFDAEEQAWDSVVAWLTRLRLLEGVPFSYIVSVRRCYQMVDSIFHMDRNWLDALVDGALSTGILDTRGPFASADDELKKELYEKLMNELNDRELIHNPLRASLTLHDKQKAKDSSAFDSIEMKAREKGAEAYTWKRIKSLQI